MANSYEYLLIFLLSSSCVSGGIGSEYTYSCDLQLLNQMSAISLGDREEGKISDCIQIGWIESQKQFGLETGESAVCSKALSSECRKTDQLTSSNDEFEFVETIGNDVVGLNINCKIDVDDDDAIKIPINVWQCGDDVIHRYYILKSAPVPERIISKIFYPSIYGELEERTRDYKSKDIVKPVKIKIKPKVHDKCNIKNVQKCYLDLNIYTQKRYADVAVNKEQLVEFCSKAMPAVFCVKDRLEDDCKDANAKVDKMYYEFTLTVKNLCDIDSHYSNDYLKHAPCLAGAYERVFACLKGKSDDRKPSSDNWSSVERFCCDTRDIIVCSEEVYYKQCGPKAGQIGYQIAKTMLGQSVQAACVDSRGYFKCCGSLFSMSPIMPLATFFIIFRRSDHL